MTCEAHRIRIAAEAARQLAPTNRVPPDLRLPACHILFPELDVDTRHNGKDGMPHPVDRLTYDTTIDVLRRNGRPFNPGSIGAGFACSNG